MANAYEEPVTIYRRVSYLNGEFHDEVTTFDFQDWDTWIDLLEQDNKDPWRIELYTHTFRWGSDLAPQMLRAIQRIKTKKEKG